MFIGHPCAGHGNFGSIKVCCCIDSSWRHIISNHKIYRKTDVYCFITWYGLYEIVLEAIVHEWVVFNFVQNSQPTRYLVNLKESGYKCVAQTMIFIGNLVNTIVTDALAPRVPGTSATMVLNMQVKEAITFHVKGFRQHAPSQCWGIIENTNIYSFVCFQNNFNKTRTIRKLTCLCGSTCN